MKANTILLVEDNADEAELAIRAFERTQLESAIVLARDGGEGLNYLFATGRYAEPPPGPPDVVLLDLKLPRIDGVEVLRRVREDRRTRRLPVVVMTSSKQATDVGRCYELGANSYARKPVDFSEFVQTMHRVGTYWQPVAKVSASPKRAGRGRLRRRCSLEYLGYSALRCSLHPAPPRPFRLGPTFATGCWLRLNQPAPRT